MSQEGFLFDELSEFKQNLLRDIKENYPKETEKYPIHIGMPALMPRKKSFIFIFAFL